MSRRKKGILLINSKRKNFGSKKEKKIYTTNIAYESKARAKKEARKAREEGYLARVFKYKPKHEKINFHAVYTKKKKVSKNLKKTAKKKYPKMKRGSSATKKDVRKMKVEIKSWRIPEKKQKEKHLVSLKREKAMAEKGWKVARTKTYLEMPKNAIGKEGYPYAILNKNNTYESFYTWKEKKKKKS